MGSSGRPRTGGRVSAQQWTVVFLAFPLCLSLWQESELLVTGGDSWREGRWLGLAMSRDRLETNLEARRLQGWANPCGSLLRNGLAESREDGRPSSRFCALLLS